MIESDTAAYDTLFYLHHSYVDYQWAFWQEVQRLRNQSDPKIEGFDQPLPPFDSSRFNSNTKTLQNSRAQDTFDYQKKFCYEDDQLLFDNLTPAQFIEVHQKQPVSVFGGLFSMFRSSRKLPKEGRCGLVCRRIDGKRHCEEICSNNGVFARVSVGVVLPKKAATGINVFELCQDGRCVEAGRLVTFGAHSNGKDSAGSEPAQIDKENYFLRDTDVTAVVTKQRWTLKKPFVARMTKSVVRNLPDPVVIHHQLGRKGNMDEEKISITINPEEKPRRYGNLIHGYKIKKIRNNKNTTT